MKEDKKELTTIEQPGHMPVQSDLLSLAIQQGAGVDQLEKLMELQERFEKNEARKAFNTAMAEFKAECPIIPKNSKGQSGKFAGLADIAKVIDPLLAKNGLSYRWQQSQSDENKLTVTCVVTHTGGFAVESPLTGPYDTGGNKNPIQSIGSSNAYLFRYTLNAALGLASAEMDDDGVGAGTEYIDEDQLATINEWIESIGGDCFQNFKKYIGVDELDKILAKDYKKAITALKNTEKKKTGAK